MTRVRVNTPAGFASGRNDESRVAETRAMIVAVSCTRVVASKEQQTRAFVSVKENQIRIDDRKLGVEYICLLPPRNFA